MLATTITKLLYNSFHDLLNSTQPQDRMIHDFFVILLDQLFGQHDQIRIDKQTENKRNHEIIKHNWKMIRLYFDVPDSAKYTQKCVRQTLIHIINKLNQIYGFTKPLKFEQKRHDYYSREKKGNVTDYWTELIL